MHLPWAWYLLGIGTAVAARATGRPLGQRVRPLAREAIKGGLIINREVQRMAEEARATLGDLTAEARAQLDAQEQASGDGTSGEPNGR